MRRHNQQARSRFETLSTDRIVITADVPLLIWAHGVINTQDLPGDSGKYGRRWIVSIPASSCQEGRVGLCPRVLVSANMSLYPSEFVSLNSTSDDFAEELRSDGGALSGTGAMVTSSRWIEGWRGFEQQVQADENSFHQCGDEDSEHFATWGFRADYCETSARMCRRIALLPVTFA